MADHEICQEAGKTLYQSQGAVGGSRMKKKIIVGIAVCATLVIVIVGIVYGIKIYQREQDPFWQLAKKLYNVESALQEIDESWELQSLTQVTPYCYQDPDGDTITYYCCITTYVGDEPSEYFGINQAALEQVVEMDALENRRDCEVNGLEAVMGELDGQTYLCWTVSPKYSCVIEFVPGTIDEADVFQIAESVSE
jgi:hypothetical protein